MDHAQLDAHRKMVTLPQGEIAYADVGSGPTVLFVHGVFLHAALWRNVIEAIGPTRRCIAIDLPAHGRTRVHPGENLRVGAQAELLLAFCDALGLEQVDVVANDTGGAVAQVFAATHPERVRTLALTNCDCHTNLPPERFAPAVELAKAGQLAPALEQMAADPGLARSDMGIGVGFEHPDRLTDGDLRSYGVCAASPEAARETERFIASLDAADLLAVEPALRVFDRPTLIVWGTDDVFFDMSWAQWLRDTIPGALDIVEVDGAKLFFPDERGGELAGHLERFWSTVEASATT